MHIKSIEINGFKSYGSKTEIKGFDPLFNAITGLNGSGKSNILDAICFVLGISNLSQVRASSLQELVYKNGQAGVTKAAVSITFDNSDPNNSPVGYEQHKEITVTRIVIIGGRNKYLINGSVAQNHRVQDFFQSVQLNVNNPHFLIMQGRITKVLNMKPMEILSMVEEAAGTRMYEMKKESSIKLMNKKEDRLMEIDNILKEEITPTLEKLKNERKDYIEYTRVVRELDHLTKLHIAFEFTQAQNMCMNSKENMKKIEDELEKTKKNVDALKEKMQLIRGSIAELEKKRDEEAGGKLGALEDELKKKQMAESKVNNSLQNLKATLKDDTKKKTQLIKEYNEEKNTLAKREKDIGKLQKKVQDLKNSCEADSKAVVDAEKHLHNVNAGLVKDSEGKAATIASQLMDAEEEIKRSETEEKMASMSIESLKQTLAKKQSAYTEMDDSYKNNQAAYRALEKEASRLKEEIDKLCYDDNKAKKVKYEKEVLEKEVDRLRLQLDELQSRFPQLVFEYVDPVKNFDRQKVFGLVCKLFTVKDVSAATALELAAGGKLLNVAVDNDTTAKMLLDRGQLKRRCTIIPLNKIIGQRIDKEVVARAERLVGKQNVNPAIFFIKYDLKLQAVMEYVFGQTFIGRDMESAKKVAFADGIKIKCVTFDGEVFDPAGTLSGGSMNQRNQLLLELSKMKEIEKDLSLKRANLNNVTKDFQKMLALSQKHESIQEVYELKMSEMAVLKAKIEQSNYHHQVKEIEELKQSIAEKQDVITKCKELRKKAEARYKKLKSTDTESARRQELQLAEKNLTDCQKRLASSEKVYKETEQELEQLQLEAVEIGKSIQNYEDQIQNLTAVIQSHEGEIAVSEENYKEKKREVSVLLEEVKAQKAVLKSHSIEIGKLHKEQDAMSREIENFHLHMQQLEHDISKSDSDSKEAQKNVNRYLSTYQWIEEEKKYFGVPNTEYDFTNYDAKASVSHINKLEDTKAKLGKLVNMRAQNMLTSAEEQYKDLISKKKVVLNDKAQIQNVIKELDERKKIALRSACENVNKDFGSIFSTLLPGAKAKLVPQENRNVLEGLEFKVGFGDVWKESLTELSGGQRSLVALSLILSLLLFKPAPIYILDEVDAALDLSHTQNIGQMLKKHFQKSQFIVVSLKDGMFNNANVLFKTKFVDGMSTVTRVTQK